MPVHDWSHDPPVPHESFHAAWIIEIVRRLNREVLPEGYRAYAERHLGILQPDVTTFQERHAAVSQQGAASWPQEWSTTAVVEYDPSPERYAIRVEAMGASPVAFLELVSRSNKESAVARTTFVEHLAVHIADGLHLILVDVLSDPPANLHAELAAHLNDLRENADSISGPLYVCSYRNLGPRADSARGRLEACYRAFDIGSPLPDTTLWLSDERWVTLDLEHTYRETCITMRVQ